MRDFLSSPDFPELLGIRWNLGEFGELREISGKLRGIQRNSVGFCMALSRNSVGIPGGFRGNAGFSGKFGVWGGFGRFGGSKGFSANSHFEVYSVIVGPSGLDPSEPLPQTCFRPGF